MSAPEFRSNEQTRRHMITCPFPLSDDFVAYMNIPHDLRPDEAERMATALKALALPAPPGANQGERE